MASQTLRPSATAWRSGYDEQQHRAIDALTAVCGEQVREQRYDRPDWPKCPRCVLAGDVGITVPAPRQETLDDWAPGELTEAFGR